jgi:hypothetical protein
VTPNSPRIYRQNPAVAWRAIDGEAVLIDPSNGTVFVLNRLGARIWALLEEPRGEEELAGALSREHPGEGVRIAEDVSKFLGALSERALVEGDR